MSGEHLRMHTKYIEQCNCHNLSDQIIGMDSLLIICYDQVEPHPTMLTDLE